jgi:hypothetical protein
MIQTDSAARAQIAIYNKSNSLYVVPRLFSQRCEAEKLTGLEDKVRGEVGKIVDPETGMTFAEMQMITNVKEEA